MAIKVIRVLHEQSELNQFGINDNINVLLSEVPQNVKESFYIYRLNPDVDIPEVGDKYYKNLQLVDSQMKIDYDFSVSNEAQGQTLKLNPKDPLMPGQRYALIVTSDIRKQGDIQQGKTTQLGPADIICGTKKPIAGVDFSDYQVKFVADSVLTKKSNLITASVIRTDTISGVASAPVPLKTVKKDIFSDTLIYSDDYIYINALQPAIPFLNTEEFLITVNGYQVEQQTKIIAVITANKSVQVTKPPVPSGRLTISEFNEFYDALARQQAGGTTDPDQPITIQKNAVKFEYRPPKKLRFTVDKYLDKNSLRYQDSVDAGGNPIYKYKKCVNFNFDYAFGNYLLRDMGLYFENPYMIIQDVFANVIEFELLPLDVTNPAYTAAQLIEITPRYHLLMKV